MKLKGKHFIVFTVLLIAMMSVAVAADVNDSTEPVTTPAVTQQTTDMQTAVQADNEITEKTDNNIEKETNNQENTRSTTHNLNDTNDNDITTSDLSTTVNEEDILSDVTSTNNDLNKKISGLIKTEGEPTVIDITEDNFSEYFNNNNNGIVSIKGAKLTSDTIFNMYYIPDTCTFLQYFAFSWDSYSKYDVTLVGKNDFTLKNIRLAFSCGKFTLTNMTIIYDDDYTEREYYKIQLSSTGNSPLHMILDNVKINYTTEYDENTIFTLILLNYDGQVTIQNSEFNIKVPATQDTTKLFELSGSNTEFINNTVNIEEIYGTGDNPSIQAIVVAPYETRTVANNVTIKDNTININGESTITGIKIDTNSNTIINNNITVTTTETATGVELNGNDSTVTDNYIVANDKKGDEAVTVTGENNVVQDNLPNGVSIDVSNYQELYDAVETAKADEEETTYIINLLEGEYTVTTPITWGSSKSVKQLTINGNDQTINGDKKQFLTINKGYTLNLNNIAVTDCENSKDGGAITNKGTLNLDTVTLENNKANFGGAIYNSKDITITNSQFINNSAINGGALANTNYATATITNTIFNKNSADNIGGAIENEHYSTTTITDSTFTENSATNGGALDANQATLTLTGNTFDSNNATDYAGAIYARLFANVTMNQNTLTNNYAGDDGGAIYNYFNTTFIGEDNIIANNKALNYGGAIYNDEAVLIFTHNNITDNEVITYGGGALYNTNYADGHFIENIIANNTAKTNGGAVYVSSSNLELVGNLIADQVARQGGALYLIQYCNVNITDNTLRNNVASTNAGAIYTNSVNLMRITGNTIEDNRADDGAALFSTGGNVLFDSNTVTGNVATNPAKKVISNTGTLVSTNNVFTANTDGTDMLMSQTGTNTVSDNTYTANKLETIIEQISDDTTINDYEFEVSISPKEVYNTTVNTGEIKVTINDNEVYTGAYTEPVKVTISSDDIDSENTVKVEYIPANDDFQASTMTFKLDKSNNLKVSDYESLYNTVEQIKQSTLFDDVIISLEEGDYTVTTPIEWSDSLKATTLTINGNGQTIKGDGKSLFYIDEEYTLNINNMEITGCENGEDGGAIINEGTLNIENVTFTNNKANYGGAIVSHGTITIEDSTFINNSASNGGALANTNYATATITGTTFESNSAVTMGGAIYNEHYSTMTIEDTVFTANGANNGGAIDNDQATLTITDSEFTENTCLDYGGAIYNRFYANLTLTDNTFTHNQALEDEGGVIYNYFKSNLIAEENEFVNNYAFRYGAVIFNDDSEATFTNNDIIDNYVDKFGGTVIYNANGAHATFTENFIANNTALTNGGVVYTASSDIDLIGNVFTGNKARQGAALYFIGANTNTVINNRISDNIAETNGGAIYNTASQPLTVTGNIIENNVAAQGSALYSTGEVVFTDNNVTNNTVSNPTGKVIYNTKTLTATGNTFTDNTDGNDILMSETGTNTINDNTYTGNMLETTIDDIDDAEVNADFTFDVNINAKEVYNTEVNSGTVTVKVNGEEYTTVDVADGKTSVTIAINDLEDENVVDIEYANEEGDFQISTTSFNLVNTRSDAILTIDDITNAKYNEISTISGKLTDNEGNAIANAAIKLLINNGRKTLKTDSEGVFTFDYKFTRTGENTITATFLGNKNYNSAEAASTVEVGAADAVITLDKISSVQKGEQVTISGRIADNNGNAIANAQVKIMINGSPKTIKADANGVFTYTYTMNKIGTNNITVKYTGSAKYAETEVSTTVEVTKAQASITITPIAKATKGSNVTITGTLKDANGNTVANAQVRITVNDSPKTLRTDENGVYTHIFTMYEAGTTNITATFNGNNNLKAANATTTVEVIKS